MRPGDVVVDGGDPHNQILEELEENQTPLGPSQPQSAPFKAIKKKVEDPQDIQEFEKIQENENKSSQYAVEAARQVLDH